jgi:hypothetical protein
MSPDARRPRGSGEVTTLTRQPQHPDWTFLSNHTHVLHCIFIWPGVRIRDIAAKVLITERAVQRIVVDLEREGYLKRDRVGRQNHYRLKPGLHLRHPLEQHVKVGRLLDVLQPATVAAEPSVAKRPNSTVAIARRRNRAPSRSGAKPLSALRKRPIKPRQPVAKPRKPMAKKPL